MSGGIPGKLPAGEMGKDLECGVVNLGVMDQKFSLLKKPDCRYVALLIVYIGTWTTGHTRTLLSPTQFLDTAFIRSMTISDSRHTILDGLETRGWNQADYALSGWLCYLHSRTGSVS